MKAHPKFLYLFWVVFVIALSWPINTAFSYRFDCDSGCKSICASGDYLCLFQCNTCCPVSEVNRQQDCEECQGYWYSGTCHLTPQGIYTIGDVNGDGTLNIVDALFIARHAVGLSVNNFNEDAADVNCDGHVNIVDALFVARKAVGLSVPGWCGE